MMAEEFAEFDEWLRQIDADMQESVESAMDVEGELVAFKQKAFAQIVAVAHAEGNDAPDKAVRSVLADAEIADRCGQVEAAEGASLAWGKDPTFFKGVTVFVSHRQPDGERSAKAPRRVVVERQEVRVGSLPAPPEEGWSTRLLVTCATRSLLTCAVVVGLGAVAALGAVVGVTWVHAHTGTAAVLPMGLAAVIGLATLSPAMRAVTLVLMRLVERRAEQTRAASNPVHESVTPDSPDGRGRRLVVLGDSSQSPDASRCHQFHGPMEAEAQSDEPQGEACTVVEPCPLLTEDEVRALFRVDPRDVVKAVNRRRRARATHRRVGDRPPRMTGRH